MLKKLKPCPFCGGEAILRPVDVAKTVFHVYCNENGCTHAGYSTKEKAIKKWNARSTDENLQLTIEELKEINADMENRSWVWVELLPEYKIYKPYSEAESAYYRVQKDYTEGKAFCCGYPGFGFYFKYEDYGETWLAYRRKPEEVIHE